MTIWPNIECTGRKLGYARVSTKDQKLRMQRDALNAIDCDEIFEDHGVSGAKASRPGLDALLLALAPGDAVVVFKLDRLGRSVLQLADLLVQFQRDGIHFCSISEGINTTTPGGKFVFHVFAAVAEFQREIIVENTLEGLEAAKRDGKRLGRPLSLTPDEVIDAHQRIAIGQECFTSVASRFGVSRMTLSRGFERLGLV